MSKLLEVKNLKTSFKTHIGDVQSVRGVSFHLNKGEALGVVGESGCGKSVTMMTIMRLPIMLVALTCQILKMPYYYQRRETNILNL